MTNYLFKDENGKDVTINRDDIIRYEPLPSGKVFIVAKDAQNSLIVNYTEKEVEYILSVTCITLCGDEKPNSVEKLLEDGRQLGYLA